MAAFWLFRLLMVSLVWSKRTSARPAVSLRNQTRNLADEGWQSGVGTWYGPANGAGSDGGACGYESLAKSGYTSSIVAGNNAIFSNGLGCGRCYEVKCTGPKCRATATKVVVTDQCPECVPGHLDFSGTAFNNLAVPEKASELRQDGKISIVYRRVQCNYEQPLTFKVDPGSNEWALFLNFRYVKGAGDLQKAAVRQEGASNWQDMKQIWGATWNVQLGEPYKGPLSVRITDSSGVQTICKNSIPATLQPGATYTC